MSAGGLPEPLVVIPVSVPATAAGGYTIVIGCGILDRLGGELERQFAGRTLFIVTDAAVAGAGHLERLLQGRKTRVYVIDPPGEHAKHIGTVVAIIEAMEQATLGRDSVIAALGGGTVGDIAGLAAALFKRGVPAVQVPTTTVSQADSAVGGKTGVDSTISKNAFGVFWPPAAVYIDTATLTTLDERQYRAGLAESVKHAAIADAGYFEYLEGHADLLLRRDGETLMRLAEYNCRIKAAVVEEDPTEKNRRRVLNYGHTIGHAVESASGYGLLHGEAVAIGMAAAGRIEERLGLANVGRRGRIEALLVKLGLPVRIPADMEIDRLADLLERDKKAVGRRPRFVLLERLGQALCREGQWAHEVKEETVREVVEEMREGKH